MAVYAGWVVAALLFGIMVGVVLAWRFLPQPRTHAVPRSTAPPPSPREGPKVNVLAPPEPEEIAQALVKDEVQERMIADFVEKDGVSPENAKRAVEEILERFQRMGADQAW